MKNSKMRGRGLKTVKHHSYYEDRQCDHWECEIVNCVHQQQEQQQAAKGDVQASTPNVSQNSPLHVISERQTPIITSNMKGTANTAVLRMETTDDRKTSSSRKILDLPTPLPIPYSPLASNGLNTNEEENSPSPSTLGQHEGNNLYRPSLAGFLFGGESLSSITTSFKNLQQARQVQPSPPPPSQRQQQRNHSEAVEDDSATFCSSTASSEFWKSQVTNITLVDNTGNPGIYTGTIHRQTFKPHGQGTMAYEDVIYEGQWVNGDWCGFGRLTDITTGDVYQGGFFDNMKHGLGVMKYADGRVYDGIFQLDKLEGKGHLTNTDGTKFWGYWSREGVPHGRGKKTFGDGSVYDGEFEHGVFQGHGRMTYPDGSWYLGEWSDGKPNGLGMRVAADGKLLYEGMYANGEPCEGSSFPTTHRMKSSDECLLYRSSVASHGGTLVGPLPRQVYMRRRMDWALKNL